MNKKLFYFFYASSTIDATASEYDISWFLIKYINALGFYERFVYFHLVVDSTSRGEKYITRNVTGKKKTPTTPHETQFFGRTRDLNVSTYTYII